MRYHKCNNNKCIALGWMCDGDDDCTDGSDETKALCGRYSGDSFLLFVSDNCQRLR